MSIFEKNRFEIWNATQHPFKHSLTDFGYSNPALPGVTNVESAMNWIFAVLYPNTLPAVSDPASLPLVGNTINDYRVVTDDGDGKAAGYRWEQREGDVAPKWYKIYDMDWGEDTVLSKFLTATQGQYVYKQGIDDVDDAGAVVAGLYAGQVAYGGQSSGTNFTLNANSGDGVGAESGFVQIDSPFRPTIDNTFDLSTATERWKDAYFSNQVVINTMTISGASIVDSSGTISFDNENLTTTGNITGSVVTGSSLVADDGSDTATLVPGSYTDTTGAVSFGAANLSTTGTLGAGVATFTDATHTVVIDPNTGANRASITASRGTIDFVDENLITTGTLDAGVITGTQLNIDSLRLDGNTISSTAVDTNIILLPNGTGVVDVQKTLQTLAITATGTVTVTGQADIDNIRINGNTISSIDVNGPIILDPNGTGVIQMGASLIPSPSGANDIGSAAALLNDIFLSGGIRNATNEIAIGTLLAFRSGIWRDLAQTTPAQDGDALFYDSVNGVWLASVPDSEVDHTTIANITVGDAGHTQFVMLAGRAGGQIIQGGTAASENLVLESTANATKGNILVRDNIIPETNASFSGGWSGTDIGDGTHYYRDVYTKGEFFGLRMENVTSGTIPAASAQNIGRVVYATDVTKAYIDTGTAFKVLGVSKYVGDTAWNGTDTLKNVDVSSEITDARNAQCELLDNANDFEKMYVTIKATSASNVRIETSIPLPVGSYRLIVIE